MNRIKRIAMVSAIAFFSALGAYGDDDATMRSPFLRLSYRPLEFGAGIDRFVNGGRDIDTIHWVSTYDRLKTLYGQSLSPEEEAAWMALQVSDGDRPSPTEGPVTISYPFGAQAQVRLLGEFLSAGVSVSARRYDCPIVADIETPSEELVLSYRRDDIDVSPYVAVSFPWNTFGARVDTSTGMVSGFAAKFAIRGSGADHFLSVLAEFDIGATMSFSEYSVVRGTAAEHWAFFSAPLLAESASAVTAPTFRAYPWFAITLVEYIYRPRWSPAGLKTALSWEFRGNTWSEATGVDEHYDQGFLGSIRQTLVLSAGLAL